MLRFFSYVIVLSLVVAPRPLSAHAHDLSHLARSAVSCGGGPHAHDVTRRMVASLPDPNAGFGPRAGVVVSALDATRHLAYLQLGSSWGDEATSLTVVDLRSGRVARTIRVAAPFQYFALDAARGRIITGNLGDSTGGTASTYSLIDVSTGRTLAVRTSRRLSLRTVVIDDATGHAFLVYATSIDMVDDRTGAVLTSIVTPRGAGAQALVDRPAHRLFVRAGYRGDGLTSLLTLDTRSGRLVRAVTLRGPGPMTVDEGAGRVFVTTDNGDSVTTLDAATARILRRERIPASGDLALDARGHRVYVTDVSPRDVAAAKVTESISVLDAHTGATLATVPLFTLDRPDQRQVLYPGYITAVDGRRSRLFFYTTPLDAVGADGSPLTLRVLDARTLHVLQTRDDGERGYGYVVLVDDGLSRALLLPPFGVADLACV